MQLVRNTPFCRDMGKKNYIPYAHHYKPRLVYFYPIFENHFFVFKEAFSESSVLMYGWYSRAGYDGARTEVKNIVHSHFDLVSWLLALEATEPVSQMQHPVKVTEHKVDYILV